MRKVFVVLIIVFIVFGFLVPLGYTKGTKIGYVDLKRAFYEYDKAKNMEDELNLLTETSGKERSGKVEEITKLRDEIELLTGDVKTKKQQVVDVKLAELQTFDKETRKEILTKRNDMFREVIDNIQKVVDDLGKKGDYEYIIDLRNIMYAKEDLDLTDEVLKRLNK